MSLETLKIDLAKQLFNIDKKAVLNRIKDILDKEEIVAYTVDGKSLTKKEYIATITEAEKDIEKGNYTTQEQLLVEIRKW